MDWSRGSGGAADGLVFNLGIGVEVGLGVDDLDVLESGGFELALVVGDADGAGDAANVGHDVVGEFGREGFLEGDIGDGEAAAGLEDADDLLKDGGLVGGEIDDAVGDDAIDGGGGEGNFIDGGKEELDVFDVGLASVFVGAVDHGLGHVDADGATGGSDFLRGEKNIKATAGAQVHDGFAGLEVGGGGGVSAGEAHVCLGGDGGELFGGVAEGFGDGVDAGVIGGESGLGDLAVLGFDGGGDVLSHEYSFS